MAHVREHGERASNLVLLPSVYRAVRAAAEEEQAGAERVCLEPESNVMV